MKQLGALLVVGALAFVLNPKMVDAFPQLKAAFGKRYAKVGKEYEVKVKKAGCKVCHSGNKKANRNDYGAAIDLFLNGKAWKKQYKVGKAKALKQFEEIMAKVEKLKGVQKKSFGELIKDGELPGVDKIVKPSDLPQKTQDAAKKK